MKKKRNAAVLTVAMILFCSNIFFMSYMKIDTDELDSLYNSYFRTYQTGDFRSISSSVVSWENYIYSADGSIGSTVVDRSSLLAILMTMAQWYLDNVTTYSRHLFDTHYFCDLTDAYIRDDCSGFTREYVSLVCGFHVSNANSSGLCGQVPQDWYDSGWRCYSSSDISSLEIGDILVNNHHVEVCMGAEGTFGWGQVQHSCPSSTTVAVLENGVVKHGSNTYDYVVRYEGPLIQSSGSSSGGGGSSTCPTTPFNSANWKQAIEDHYGNTGRSGGWTSVTHNGQLYIYEIQGHSTWKYNVKSNGANMGGAGCMWFAMAAVWSNLSGNVYGVNDLLSAIGVSMDLSDPNNFSSTDVLATVGSNTGAYFNGVQLTVPGIVSHATGYTVNTISSNNPADMNLGSDRMYILHVMDDHSNYLSAKPDDQHWFVIVGEDNGDYLLLTPSGASKNGCRISKSIVDSANINHIYEIIK